MPWPGVVDRTVAVKTTGWFGCEGVADDTSAGVLVLRASCTNGALVVGGEIPLPPYVPPTLWKPSDRVLRAKEACWTPPTVVSASVARGTPSMVNVTVPVGMPTPGTESATTAVNFTV